MPEIDLEAQALSHYLIDEIVMAFGMKSTKLTHWVFNLFLGKVTDRLAGICVVTDRKIETDGFPSATGWMASNWVRAVRTRGIENIPLDGPLLVVSNHVGAYDILVAPSQIGRKDIKIIASASPFFKNLPNASRHMIYASNETGSRMAAARKGIRHLQAGGALLLFGTGLIDPDPDVYPDAETDVSNWSGSIDLFLKYAPETMVVICMLSGIVLRKWAYSPLTWFRQVDWQKRRIAEYGQVIEQLFFPGRANIHPSMSISSAVDIAALKMESVSGEILPAVISRGKELLANHIRWIQSIPGETVRGR
jgi:hypothetical protein